MDNGRPSGTFVCECITSALFRLMKTKKYDKITIMELTRTAGVSRNSFYRNFASTEDILRRYLAEQTSKWWESYIEKPNPHIIAEIFGHFLGMREAIDLIYSAGLSYLLMEHIAMCGRQSLTGELSNVYHTAFMSGGLWGLVNEWVMRGMRESPAEMESLFFSRGQGEL